MKPMIIFNIGWMRHYRGQTKNDRICNGGKYVDIHQMGYEVENFLPQDLLNAGEEKCYGYVKTPGQFLNMERLGADPNAESLDGVTVVFTATRPNPRGGRFVVGWYKNARVWRKYRPFGQYGYSAEASIEHCMLLDEDERVFQVPSAANRGGLFGVGQSNVRYLDEPRAREFVKRIRDHIQQRGRVSKPAKRSRQRVDTSLIKEVETAAVRRTLDHYEARGFNCVSVERDNVGWDLECSLKDEKLLVEVKGCSGTEADVELTPNEYNALKRFPQYRLAIVTDALAEHPKVAIIKQYKFDKSKMVLLDQDDQEYSLAKKTAARIRSKN